jgi:hypothetical protein
VNFERGGFYSCKKCSSIKRRKTNLEKYGVECITQLEHIRNTKKEWMSSLEFRNKSIEKQIEKHGCLFVQTDEFKENNSIKIKENIKIKKELGNYYCPLSLTTNKDLREKGMFEKYGHTFSYHVEEIRNKIINSNLEKFGHISPFGNKEIQKKIKENIYKNLEREWKFNGDKYKIDLFKIYRRKIRYETDILRKELFENWNGYDYYDGEYIKDKLSLNRNHSDYPSIDHKVSCFYGFINNIPTTEISNMNNLCITKRKINSKKSQLNENDFFKIFKDI